MASLDKRYRDALAPFAAVYAGAAAMLDSLTDDELIEFVEACGHVSTTNCWVYAFDAANGLRNEAMHLLRQRNLSLPGSPTQ